MHERRRLVRHPGNEALFRAVQMSVVSTLMGVPFHLHAEGGRGTGKTTVIRSVRPHLPSIRRVKGCIYNCDPSAPHCPHHAAMSPERIGELGAEWVPMPFLEVSASAKLGTVVGSIDLEKITDPANPRAAFLPGTLPQAHRGIVFVDEINRLADVAPELADVLLDVMGTKPGRIQMEETGLPRVELPLRVSVWAASNPDEEPGPLEEVRRQLADRFDLLIKTRRPGGLQVVEEILRLSEEACSPGYPSPAGGTGAGGALAEEWPEGLGREGLSVARAWGAGGEWLEGSAVADDWRFWNPGAALAQVAVPPDVRLLMARLYVEFGVESLRGIEALQWGARLAAAIDGLKEVKLEQVRSCLPLALGHRVEPQVVSKMQAFLDEWAGSRAVVAATGARRGGHAHGTAPAESHAAAAADHGGVAGAGAAGAGAAGGVMAEPERECGEAGGGRRGGRPPDRERRPGPLARLLGSMGFLRGAGGADGTSEAAAVAPPGSGWRGCGAAGGRSAGGGSAGGMGGTVGGAAADQTGRGRTCPEGQRQAPRVVDPFDVPAFPGLNPWPPARPIYELLGEPLVSAEEDLRR